MANTTSEQAPPLPPVVHVGFTCDRSGVSPIVGVRFTKPSGDEDGNSYDLCQAEFDKITSPEESPVHGHYHAGGAGGGGGGRR